MQLVWAIHLTSLRLPTENLIVDANNDLNVYKAKGGDSPSPCCGKDAEKPCCEKSSSYCNDKEPVLHDDFEAIERDFADLDFNEWAGTSDTVSRPLRSSILAKTRLGSFKIYAIKA